MIPYWVIFALFALGSLGWARKSIPSSSSSPPIAFIASLILITAMIGLRSNVGGDWATYEKLFEQTKYLSLSGATKLSDPGYMLLNWTAHQLGAGIWLVNLGCGAIFTWGLYKLCRQQPNPWLAVAVAIPYLVIVVAMGYTRQAAAIGFIMAGVAYVSQRQNFGRFIIFCLFAALFHKTSIVVLPLVLLAPNKSKFVFGIITVIVGLLFYDFFLSDSVSALTRSYIDRRYSSEGAVIRVFMTVVPALIFMSNKTKFGFDNHIMRVWTNFSLASIGLALLLFVVPSTVVDRLALYLLPLQFVVISRMPGLYFARYFGYFLVLSYAAAIQFVWLNYALHASAWLPYRAHLFWGERDPTGSIIQPGVPRR